MSHIMVVIIVDIVDDDDDYAVVFMKMFWKCAPKIGNLFPVWRAQIGQMGGKNSPTRWWSLWILVIVKSSTIDFHMRP